MPSQAPGPDVLENPADLLRQTRENFSIAHDLQLLNATEENLRRLMQRTQQLEAKGAQELSELQAQQTERAQAAEAMRAEKETQAQHLQALTHSQDLVRLANELEELEQQLVSLRAELDEGMTQLLQTSEPTAAFQGDAEHEQQSPEVQTNLLKLQLYSSLGVTLDTEHNQALIERGDAAGIDLIALEDDSLSPFFRTKYVWDRL
ncbi:AFR203Cp [Eremothecium gossypii ATCC 10895]|uniref:Probable kinetochore protein SPC24 n=1 Tax=Eremothecium gossypii (strain ATCC 10895 / CBS 109.51 / FGSC 9923 / NRRL Y-1056) TaxID=284811 RepID=SPC24_EREGS|nr:AFR203Cp [Eremothecium gossypii ATCC 10895]Q753W9.1 RecName: Full=Probable kinetochore protein SPC24 [Eremothecium gossypii ATCC 10895]AAS53574.1 AFR203Cp [Eremothecium gossypii ATCC 10895]AEY97887.1 FAFR203Cp [Eremothecium gossypii FDAG1]